MNAKTPTAPARDLTAELAFVTRALKAPTLREAEVLALKGDSYRLKDRDLGRRPTTTSTDE